LLIPREKRIATKYLLLIVILVVIIALSISVWAYDRLEILDQKQVTINPVKGILDPPAYEWPMFLHDSQHTGQLVMPGPVGAHILASASFTYSVGNGAVTNKDVLFASAGKTLYALNSSTLSVLWSYATNGVISSSPAVSNNQLFVTSTDGTILAFNALTGHKIWSFSTGEPIYSSPNVDGGIVFVGSDNGYLYAIYAANGTQVHSLSSFYPFASGSAIRTSPAIKNSIVAFGANNGVMYFINETTGLELGSFKTSGSIDSSPVFSDNMVVFGSNDSNIYAVNSQDYSLLWKVSTGGPVIGSPVVSQDGIIFVGSLDGNVYAINSSSGNLLWKVYVGPVVSSGALANAVGRNTGGASILPSGTTYLPMLYIASQTGVIYGIREDDGALFWSFDLNSTVSASPIIAYTKMYIGDDAGNIWEIGSLKYATSVGTFGINGNAETSFAPSSTVIIAADARWGKFGLANSGTVNITGPGTNGGLVLKMANLTFVTGNPQYNLYYDWKIPTNATAGVYYITIQLQDANPKYNSNNPRPAGYVDFKGNVTII
jgi:outer membrane protein assembly factor BamB